MKYALGALLVVILTGWGIYSVFTRFRRANHRSALRTNVDVLSAAPADVQTRRILEAYGLGLWVWRPDTNRLTCSSTTQSILGNASADQPTFNAFEEMLHPSDRADVLSRFQRAAESGEDLDIQFRIVRPDVDVRWIEMTGRSVHHGSVHQIEGSVTDITERKEAEASHRSHEAMLRRAQRIAHLGSWELDIQANHLQWSDEVYRIFGLKPQAFEATYEAFMERVHPEDRERMQQAQDAALADEAPLDIQHRVVRPDGELRIVHERGQLKYDREGRAATLTGTVHDITEQRQMQADLRRHNRELNVLLEASKELAATRDQNRLLKTILTTARRLVPSADAATIWTIESNPGRLVLRAHAGYPADLSGLQLETGDPAHTFHFGENSVRRFARKDGNLPHRTLPHAAFSRVQSSLGARRQPAEGLECVLFLDRFSTMGEFDERNESVLESLAAQSAVALENTGYIETMRTLSRRLLQAQETERRRIAQELHDEVSSQLTALNLSLALIPVSDADVRRELDQSIDMVRNLMNQIRDVSLELRPAILDRQGLGPAVEHLVNRMADKTNIRMQLDLDRIDRASIDGAVQTVAYRIVQEALTNVARYADTDKAFISLEYDRRIDELEVTVRDEGRGFNPSETPEGTLGLSGMRERAALIGGRCTISSTRGRGTVVTAQLPIQ